MTERMNANPDIRTLPGEFENPRLFQRLRREAPLPWIARDGAFLAAAVVLGLLIVKWALWGSFALGLSICYVLLLLWTAAYRGASGPRMQPFSLFCAVASAAAAGLYAYTDDAILGFLWLWMIALLYCIFAASLYGLKLGDGLWMIADALLYILPTPFKNLPRPFQAMVAGGKSAGRRAAPQVVLGLLLAVPVLVVVLPLLMHSDAAFEGLMQTLAGSADDSFQLILGLLIAALIFSLGFALRNGLVHSRKERAEPAGILGTATAATLLGALVLVYAAYLASQLAYFFSAFAGILPSGYVFTAAEYARRGFFELCMVCGVNLVVVCALPWLTKRGADGRAPRAVRALCAAVCGFCLVFAATAFSKMCMYVERFGLTRLRLLTSAFMVLLVFALICVLLRLFARRVPCVQAILVFACALGLALGYGEPDAMIARYNVARYRVGTLAEIDVDYLGSLSADAVPHLVELLDCPDAGVRAAAAKVLDRKLGFYSDADPHPSYSDGFQGYNRSRARARELLGENRETIQRLLHAGELLDS